MDKYRQSCGGGSVNNGWAIAEKEPAGCLLLILQLTKSTTRKTSPKWENRFFFFFLSCKLSAFPFGLLRFVLRLGSSLELLYTCTLYKALLVTSLRNTLHTSGSPYPGLFPRTHRFHQLSCSILFSFVFFAFAYLRLFLCIPIFCP